MVGVTSFEAYISVSDITDENNSFSILALSYWMVPNHLDPNELPRDPNQSNAKETLRNPQARGEETINKLKE